MALYLCPTCSQPMRPTRDGLMAFLSCESCPLLLRDWPPITRGLRVAG